MASILSSFNRLLPFATPGTPLIQDLVHLAAICLFLYLAPQLQDSWSRRSDKTADAVQADTNELETETVDQAPETETHAGQAAAVELEEQPEQAHPQAAQVEDEAEDDEAAPAERAGPSTERNVGAKKAKSLARKDQRRAYNEFMRSQGDAQRAMEAEGAEERELALEAERKRRALVEAELSAKQAKEREAKREAEQAEREAEHKRREAAVAIVKADLAAKNLSELHRVAIQVGGDVDIDWVEKIINASGIIGKKDGILTIITSTGWAARISEADARAFYAQAAVADYADHYGAMKEDKLSETLVGVLGSSASAVAVDA